MKKSTEILLTFLSASWALLACNKESIQTLYASQESRIESFLDSQLSANPNAYVVSRDGTHRLVLADGSGDTLRADGNIAFRWAGYIMSGNNLSSSNLFGTNSLEIAEAAGWASGDADAFRIEILQLSEADLVPGLKKGLSGVRSGEESIILFSGKYGFGNKALGTIPANAALAYHIWVESISND